MVLVVCGGVVLWCVVVWCCGVWWCGVVVLMVGLWNVVVWRCGVDDVVTVIIIDIMNNNGFDDCSEI